MELMSSLLLCALAALLPQALGKSKITYSYNSGFNDTVIIKRKPFVGKNIIVNKNLPSLVNKVSDMQSIFMDPICRGCYGCMERAIKTHKTSKHMMDSRISVENFQDDLMIHDENRREKRKTRMEKIETRNETKSRRSKSKKNRAITMTKYNNNDKIYALKIKETNSILDQNNKNKTVTTCQVYSIKKSFPCDSLEADLILTSSKKKINKKVKKQPGKRETNEPEVKTTVVAPVYRKRQIDNTQVPEQIMPSIEEMY